MEKEDLEDLEHLRRLRDGTATRDDWDAGPLLLTEYGTVLEVHDRDELTRIVDLVTAGVAASVPSTTRNVLCQNLASLYLERKHGSGVVASHVAWKWGKLFAINQGQPDERTFVSSELAETLASLAAKYSIRTWWWSNPELQEPAM